MAVELVTGYSGTEHVSSSDDGARQAGTVGTGMYVLETVEDPLAATLENANTVTVGAGDALVNGRHVRLTGSTTFGIPVGAQAMQTSNLLVLRYSVDDDGTEKVEAITLTGEPAASDPQDPALATGSILDGDSPVDMALYRVVTTGIESAQPVRLFSTIPPISGLPGVGDNVLDVAHGGTGVTRLFGNPGLLHDLHPSNIAGTASAELYFSAFTTSWASGGYVSETDLLLDAYPVGAVYISYNSTSPASLFGGTWMAITGRFPYFNAGTGTGGSNTHKLTVNEMPSHTHSITMPVNTAWNNHGGTAFALTPVQTDRPTYSFNQNAGGGQSHNNMPSYQTFYAWRRTA